MCETLWEKIEETKRQKLPAVTHLDGTGRLQTVDKKNNELYYNLIEAFKKISGIPILLNTSFNENDIGLFFFLIST